MISFTLIHHFIFSVYMLSSFFLHLVKRFITFRSYLWEFFRDLGRVIGIIQTQTKNKPDAALFEIAFFYATLVAICL